MKKLIGMVDFVLEQGETSTFGTDQGDWYFKEQSKLDKIRSYANLLKQPLALWMFVPCDDDGNVLELPTKENSLNTIDHENRMIEYQQAKERCLLEGFAFYEHEDDFIYISFLFNKNKCQLIIDKESNTFLIDTSLFDEYAETIEDLVKYNLELTPTTQI